MYTGDDRLVADTLAGLLLEAPKLTDPARLRVATQYLASGDGAAFQVSDLTWPATDKHSLLHKPETVNLLVIKLHACMSRAACLLHSIWSHKLVCLKMDVPDCWLSGIAIAY